MSRARATQTLVCFSLILAGCPPTMDRPRPGGTCKTYQDCDDGKFENGQETCAASQCVSGAKPCDDGIECTGDEADEAARACRHTRGQCPAGTLLSAAAFDSSQSDKDHADYRCDGVDDQTEISSALSALPAGGTLILLAGTFRLGDKLSVPGQRVIVGQGDRTKLAGVRPTGADPLPEIVLAADEVTLRDFELTGHIKVLNSSSHIRLRNLVARDIVGDACAVFQNYAVGRTIEDIELNGCQVIGSVGDGFVNGGEGASGSYRIRDLRLVDCKAVSCGKGSPCAFGRGFALNDAGVALDGCEVTRCRAERSWRSGFFLVDGGEKKGIVLRECASVSNSRATTSDPSDAGYVVSGDAKLYDCSSQDNVKGYFVVGKQASASSRPELYRCRDQGSQHGLHIDNAAHVLVKDSVLEGNRLGVWAKGSEDLVLRNVTITDPIGEIDSCGATPSCNLFGCGSYALSRSQLELKICGCKTDCALFTENGTELVFTGRVCRAGSANPLCIPAGSKADTSGVELVSP